MYDQYSFVDSLRNYTFTAAVVYSGKIVMEYIVLAGEVSYSIINVRIMFSELNISGHDLLF